MLKAQSIGFLTFLVASVVVGQVIMRGQGDTPEMSIRYGLLYVATGCGLPQLALGNKEYIVPVACELAPAGLVFLSLLLRHRASFRDETRPLPEQIRRLRSNPISGSIGNAPPIVTADHIATVAPLPRNMPRSAKITVVIAGLWFLVFTAFVARPSPSTQLLSMLLTLGLFVFGFISFVRVFTHWHRERWRALVPLSVCVLVVVLAPELGAAIRQLIFQRSLPRYESIIRQIESGAIPVSSELRHISQAEGAWAYAVLARRGTNGVLTVEFLTGGGFPVKHSGYLYCSSGVIESGSLADSRWPKKQEVKPSWFRISD